MRLEESFFGHMKDEINDKILICRTITEVKQVIANYMEYYKNERGQWKKGRRKESEGEKVGGMEEGRRKETVTLTP